MTRWLFLLSLFAALPTALATLTVFAQTPTPTDSRGPTNPGRIELVTRAAYRFTHDVISHDISGSGEVIAMRGSGEYAPIRVKRGRAPVESQIEFAVPYVAEIGCDLYTACRLRHYELASGGAEVVMVVQKWVGYQEWQPYFLRGDVATGERQPIFSVTPENAVYDIAVSGDGATVAWVNHRLGESPWVETIHLRRGGATTIVTHGYDGSPPVGIAANPSLSGDGRWVAYDSEANNLVPGDSGGRDVFVYDAHGAANQRVSVAMGGAEPDGDSYSAEIDGSGRFVVFVSEASNLVPADSNGVADIFLADLETGTVRRVSIASGGGEANGASSAPSLSDGGGAVAFLSAATNLVGDDSNGVMDAFVHDVAAHTTGRASVSRFGAQADAPAESVQISAGGRHVLFQTAASLEPADHGERDLYLDAPGFATYRVNYEPLSIAAGSYDHISWVIDNALLADGRTLILNSAAVNLLPYGEGSAEPTTYVFDRELRTFEVLSLPYEGVATSQTPDGRFILFWGEEPLIGFMWGRYERLTGETKIVNSRADGTVIPLDGYASAISDDGRYAVVMATAPEWLPGSNDTCLNPQYCMQVFIKDLEDGSVSLASAASDGTPSNMSAFGGAAVSGDGLWVAYNSIASNLVPGDSNYVNDVFVHNRATGETSRVSTSNGGVEGNDHSRGRLSFSADGRYLVFNSNASNLDPEDENGNEMDGFLYDMASRTVSIIPRSENGTTAGFSSMVVISDDGSTYGIHTDAPLLPGDDDSEFDLYLRDRLSGEQWQVTIPYGSPAPPPVASDWNYSLNRDGTIVAFSHQRLTWHDFNDAREVYVFDRTAPSLDRRVFVPVVTD